jgi:hypothetical protein
VSDEEANQLDPIIASTHEKFKEIQGNPDIITAISIREADDQAKIQLGRKQLMVETIAKRVASQGHKLPEDTIEKLLHMSEKRLNALYEFVLFEVTDIERIRVEIKSYIS